MASSAKYANDPSTSPAFKCSTMFSTISELVLGVRLAWLTSGWVGGGWVAGATQPANPRVAIKTVIRTIDWIFMGFSPFQIVFEISYGSRSVNMDTNL
jgi:hypothetical protein